jgi:endonuclease YncB( thermonuclease family)
MSPPRDGTRKILIIIPGAVFGGRCGVLFAYVFVDGENINLELVRQGLNRQKDRQKKSLLLDFIINFYFNTDKLKKYKSTKKSAKCFIQLIK